MAQRRIDLSPSVVLSESYDDNVFAVPDDRRQDVTLRLSPRLGAIYRSPRLGVVARYTREAESFSRHTELSTLRARQEAIVDAQWMPGGGFEATASASYAETHTPGELAVITDIDLTGLELMRSLARRFATTQSLSRRLGARTRAVVDHGFGRDEIAGGVTSVTRVAAARLQRQVGPVDELTLTYAHRRFRAAEHGSTSHALTVTWAREVTPRAHLELKAGPRLSGQTVRPELGATLRHRFRRGDAALSYVQTEAALIGHASPLTVQGLTATLTHSLNRTLTVSGGPSVFGARGEATEFRVYRLGLGLAWRLSRHLALAGSHQLSLQYGQAEGRPRGEIAHNTVLVRFVAGSSIEREIIP
jgi:hypothetical protein